MALPEVIKMYCFRCRVKQDVVQPRPKWADGLRGKRLMAQGKCPECGTITSKYIKAEMMDGQPDTPDQDSEVAQEEPVVVQTESPSQPTRGGQTMKIVDSPWFGPCHRCREDTYFRGEYVGERWDHKKVLNGICETCDTPQIVIGVQSVEEEDE